MPSSRVYEEEDDAVPLTDLLRTGEASRLRRRGAMRNGHRREESEESVLPPSRRVRIEPGGRLNERRREGQVYLELSCGVRTAQISAEPSSSSWQSPLPQTRHPDTSSDLGFVYNSTGCGTVINSVASPSTQEVSGPFPVYISTDTSNPEVARLPSKYLDQEQRSIAEFLSRENAACKCDWEAIGCRVCGNAIGFLYIPCHSGHSIDLSRAGAHPTHIFFPSAVTPSPSYTFPSIDPAPYTTLPRFASPSVSDDMSLYSPTFSPGQVIAVPDDETIFRFRSQDSRPHDLPDVPQINDSPVHFVDEATGPTSMLTHFTPSTAPEEQPPEARLGLEPPTFHSHWSSHDSRRTDGRPLETREQSSGFRRSIQYSHTVAPRPRASQQVSDDEWSAFLERDRAPSSARHHLEGQSDRLPRHPWVPRELRERPPGALAPGERAIERLATISHPEISERRVAHFVIGPTPPPRAPDPPTLHRVPRRSLSAMIPPSRRTASLDASHWRTAMPHGFSRPTYVPERQEHTREGERGLRMSRWATMSGTTARPSRRQTPSTSTNASTPAFTLVDSAGERSYPPSAQSSLDDRDTLSVDSDAGVYRPSAHWTDSRYRDVGLLWGNSVRTEEPEADEEEKAEDEQQRDEPLERERRSPFVFRSRELVLDEQSVSSVSQLPLG